MRRERVTSSATGSSARKLRGGQANLLAGRAWRAELFPLTWFELGDSFDMERYLRFGGLPSVYLSNEPVEELDAYVNTYLSEEVRAESLVRRLPNFVRFLTTAALHSGTLLNYANVANDSQLSASTVKDYFSILEDTLIGFELTPWTKSKKRKAISTAKFYLFDNGVRHALIGTQTLNRNSDLYGQSFEHWLATELRAALSYRRAKQPLGFWRAKNGQEVDFVVGNRLAIEVQATRKASSRDAKGLRALQEEKVFERFVLVSQDEIDRQADGIRYLHWRSFLRELWQGKLF